MTDMHFNTNMAPVEKKPFNAIELFLKIRQKNFLKV